ncbi:hypothetical protein MJO29_012598 [Puccinia striiformis f. sp. tritici]|uniref:hypothetical protein n=1 Tax=Puccinia striiformis f. sp. tritici TaxID=168172 RepID=UPI00200736F2|nr:hypothetical protein Pst134EA_024071 [Puccinia striiformis f. sp. tritici]KAH9453184.1 hypothetical protein Pst134EA_024071 [Puccinia striiformis f. sp. tritici]KAI7942754.1 hypothetical protein MJO29_012598 [Puccinia striiformis f. sp. tritici]KAI9606514.1 hypothetical protein H4Q26_006048 [Puccinia striiformis f. sp. tritici PST-130]
MEPASSSFIDSIISNRNSPNKIIQLINSTTNNKETLCCLPATAAEDDPLDELIQPHTDAIAYYSILLSRLENCYNKIDTQKTLNHIIRFCSTITQNQLHLIAPTNNQEQLYAFVQLFIRWFSRAGQLQDAIEPLIQLIQANGPIHILTSLHHEFLKISIKTRSIELAVRLTDLDIDIDQQRYPIRYQDHLLYHYLAGTVQAMGGNYQRSIHLLTMTVSAPGQAISQIQVDAYKRLILVSLLMTSFPPILPPYTHPQFKTAFKTGNGTKAYLDFMGSYERAQTDPEAFTHLIKNAESQISHFQKDNNLGLIKNCLAVLPHKSIKKLTPIYTSIPLSKIDKIVGHLITNTGAENARNLVESMIENRELKAEIDPINNVLKFNDHHQQQNDDHDQSELIHSKLIEIVENVKVNELIIKEKSFEIERDQDLLKKLIIDIRSSSNDKHQSQQGTAQHHSSSNNEFGLGSNSNSGLMDRGLVDEELVDVGMAWDD